jgi:predicted small metal-binding protein
MKQFECGQVVEGCEGVVTGETEEEVLAAAARHAAEVHGMTEIPDDVLEKIQSGIANA